MINFSGYKPVVFPIGSSAGKAEMDRVQSIDPTSTLNRERVKEIGREGTVGYLKGIPTIGYRLTQLEYGSLELFRRLANKLDSEHPINITDFKTSYSDIFAYLTDDDGTFKGTLQYPDLRVAGFALNISDPDARIERTFDLAGEHAILWQGNNKYFVNLTETVDSGEVTAGDWTKTLNDPVPVADPDYVSGSHEYILRVVRVRSGVATELNEGTGTDEYEYDNVTNILTVHDAVVGDTVKIQYTASTYITAQDPFTKNDSDLAGVLPYAVSLWIGSGNYMYKLQSANIDVRFDRTDYKEIGNKNVVQRGIRNKTVTVTLGRLLEDITIDEILRGVGANYGKIDVEKFADDIQIVGKIYATDAKSTFKWGFKITNLSPTEVRTGASVDEYANRDITLESEDMIFSDTEGDLA